jgi:sugar phosphate isomerase/epimerase
VHARDDLPRGAALRYAAAAGAWLLVYQGAGGGHGTAEERRFGRLARRAGELGLRIAIENGGPAYAGGERLVGQDPAALSSLVRAIGSEHLGVCLDLGHAHIAAGLAGRELAEWIEPVLDGVVLFHVHDNFGADPDTPRAGGLEPLRLDLHLPPGAGNVPWGALAPLLNRHRSPVVLEIDAARRPEPATLATLASEVLGVARDYAGTASRSAAVASPIRRGSRRSSASWRRS